MESIQQGDFSKFTYDFLSFLQDNSGKYNKTVIVGKFRGTHPTYKVKYCYNIIRHLIFIGFIFTTGKKKLLSLSNNGEKWLKQDDPQLSINISYSKGTGDNEIFLDDKPENKKKSYIITYELFREDKSIEQIAEIRNIKTITITNHLQKCLKEGLIEKFDYGRLGFTPENHDIVMKVINSEPINGDIRKLKNIKNNCPEHITYLQIKCSLALMFGE